MNVFESKLSMDSPRPYRAECYFDSIPPIHLEGTTVCEGKYYLHKLIHKSSKSLIYLAFSTNTGKQVVIKCIRWRAISTNRGIGYIEQKQFSAKKRSCAVKIWDIHPDLAQKLVFVVMEYCENGSLSDYMKQKGFLLSKDTEFVRNIFIELIDAMEESHTKDVFHSKINPKNILQEIPIILLNIP